MVHPMSWGMIRVQGFVPIVLGDTCVPDPMPDAGLQQFPVEEDYSRAFFPGNKSVLLCSSTYTETGRRELSGSLTRATLLYILISSSALAARGWGFAFPLHQRGDRGSGKVGTLPALQSVGRNSDLNSRCPDSEGPPPSLLPIPGSGTQSVSAFCMLGMTLGAQARAADQSPRWPGDFIPVAETAHKQR